ncbi:MAG: small subunit ribosomal protein S6 [Candidatus Doudnabacteria bacterium Gr01-1014_77]|uniref:Small ribosomal subunit protein bS6 n=1 Tax=Candidatus Doudnabacteria bacterium Gr01-1014_77 TaxID=2017133 RepID=A0A554JBH0_9BACT|nr:MAG: small subunit ribosomal protein S6 [Candidatus Doudnabacteria bacterium Gr01-1014_77]
MPKYELMYIVASTVSDDQIPTVTDGVLSFIGNYEGKVIREDLMGKKKLAYPIKKTKNGFYAGITFEMPGTKINEFDAKLRTTPDIVRHIVVNIDEDLARKEKDEIAQEKMNKNRTERAKTAPVAEGSEVTPENLDQKIEEALTEDLKNV